jgi:NAD(P)-dependent dehydrogenase (short-subunit alcohol dehydrogenase family)
MMTFHRRSEAGDVAREFADKIKDKVVLITGVTMSGIGFATAKAMAENKPRRLVLVGRSQSKWVHCEHLVVHSRSARSASAGTRRSVTDRQARRGAQCAARGSPWD